MGGFGHLSVPDHSDIFVIRTVIYNTFGYLDARINTHKVQQSVTARAGPAYGVSGYFIHLFDGETIFCSEFTHFIAAVKTYPIGDESGSVLAFNRLFTQVYFTIVHPEINQSGVCAAVRYDLQ